MKMKFLAALAVSSMFALTACSDESSDPPTLADLCGNGINDNCLTGTWKLVRIESSNNPPTSITPNGVLTFKNEDGKKTMEYLLSNDPSNPQYAKWELKDSTLTLNLTQGIEFNQDIPPVFKPNVEVVSDPTTGLEKVVMRLGVCYFERNECNAMNQNETDVFERTEL